MCALCPQPSNKARSASLPQLRQFFSCVWPSAPASPAPGSTARASRPPVDRVADRFEFRHQTPLRNIMRRECLHASLAAWRASASSAARSIPRIAGHRHISLEAMRALGLDEVWWLVSPGNPLKEGAKDMAPFEARFASAEANGARRRIRVSDFESAKGHALHSRYGPAAKQRHPEAPLHLVARKRHPAKFSPMARLEGVSTRSADCGDSPARL